MVRLGARGAREGGMVSRVLYRGQKSDVVSLRPVWRLGGLEQRRGGVVDVTVRSEAAVE